MFLSRGTQLWLVNLLLKSCTGVVWRESIMGLISISEDTDLFGLAVFFICYLRQHPWLPRFCCTWKEVKCDCQKIYLYYFPGQFSLASEDSEITHSLGYIYASFSGKIPYRNPVIICLSSELELLLLLWGFLGQYSYLVYVVRWHQSSDFLISIRKNVLIWKYV